jgi:hypothetical protein
VRDLAEVLAKIVLATGQAPGVARSGVDQREFRIVG